MFRLGLQATGTVEGQNPPSVDCFTLRRVEETAMRSLAFLAPPAFFCSVLCTHAGVSVGLCCWVDRLSGEVSASPPGRIPDANFSFNAHSHPTPSATEI